MAGHPVHCPLGRECPQRASLGRAALGPRTPPGGRGTRQDPAGQGSRLCPSPWVPGWGGPILPQGVQPSQLTCSGPPPALEPSPGGRRSVTADDFPCHRHPYFLIQYLSDFSCAGHLLSLGKCSSGVPRLGHRGRGATCCPRGVSAASGAGGIPTRPPPARPPGTVKSPGNPGRRSLGSRWPGHARMPSARICVIGRKASHGGRGLGGNREKAGKLLRLLVRAPHGRLQAARGAGSAPPASLGCRAAGAQCPADELMHPRPLSAA